jgi:hypothetical protein
MSVHHSRRVGEKGRESGTGECREATREWRTGDSGSEREERGGRTDSLVVVGKDVLNGSDRLSTFLAIATAVLGAEVNGQCEGDEQAEALEGDVDGGTLAETGSLLAGEKEGGEDGEALSDLPRRGQESVRVQ